MVIIDGYDKRKREGDWHGIVIHHTGIGERKTISASKWKQLYENITAYLGAKDKNYVSAHYTIGREGETAQVIDAEKYQSFHAGKSEHWCGHHRRIVSDWNRHAIGIELIGDGNIHEYSEEQYKELARLCANLMDRYKSIHPLNILGHEAISPGRKDDPGLLFDWHKFYKLLWSYVS